MRAIATWFDEVGEAQGRVAVDYRFAGAVDLGVVDLLERAVLAAETRRRRGRHEEAELPSCSSTVSR